MPALGEAWNEEAKTPLSKKQGPSVKKAKLEKVELEDDGQMSEDGSEESVESDSE